MGTLIVFARYPNPGQVKTRLAADVGATAAATLYEAFLLDVLDGCEDIAPRRILAYTPASNESRLYFETVRQKNDFLWGQPAGNLGDRLKAAVDYGMLLGGPVVVIGSDCPSLPPDSIREAFSLLATHDAVLVPAIDGGYGLIGLSASHAEVFEDVPWSSPDVLAITLARFHAREISHRTLPFCRDIDGLDDLKAIAEEFRGRENERHENVPRRTLAALRSLKIR
jgi:rSAM/selenodomain-associated transferase 1